MLIEIKKRQILCDLTYMWNLENKKQNPVARLVKNLPAMQETPVWFLGQEDLLDRLLIPVLLGFPGASPGKESTCNAGDVGLIPGLGR